MTTTPNDLLRVAREAQRDLDAAGGHDIQIPRIGMFGLATVQAFRDACTPARIAALCELLARAEREVNGHEAARFPSLDLLPTNYMTTNLDGEQEARP